MSDPQPKVLLLAGRFEVRGTSAYTLRLAEHLGEHGITANVVSSDARSVAPKRRERLQIRDYPYLSAPVVGRIVVEMLRRDLAADPPDLIHIQSRAMLVHGARLAARLKRPFVLTVHDYLQYRERFRFDRRWGRRVIALSDSVKNELVTRTRLPEEMVTVIYGGVEQAAALRMPAVLDPGHVPVIGTAGPLEAVKGHSYFLAAAQKVLAAGRDAEFLIAGSGPEEGNLRHLARQLGIARSVTFVPNLYDFSISLAAMDIFCLPSLSQGLGTIMLEAMAMGKPVIATNVGGVYSVVRDNETGLIVPPKNSLRLAERLLELLDDPVRARALAEAGRQLVRKQFGTDRMVAQTAELYRQILGSEPAFKESADPAAHSDVAATGP